MQKIRALARSVVATIALAAMLASPAQAAGGKGSTFENALLQLIFNATAISQLALNASSSPATNLCVALHTSSPAAGGTQSTNEAAYTSYARVLVARSSSGWTVSSNSVSPASTIVFPAATGGSETETYFSIGLPTTGGACTGAQEILYFGPISPTISVSTGITPELGASTVATEN
jgi:hypothetical protein